MRMRSKTDGEWDVEAEETMDGVASEVQQVLRVWLFKA